MFPSAGYFRSANCPFFIYGLCHRPYCHFRHAKPGLGSSSKSAVKSCLKTKTTPTKTSSASSSQPSKTQTTEENNQTSTSSSLHHHDTPSTTITTNPQPATNSEPKSTTTQEQTEKNNPKVTQSKTPSILESLSKLEAAVEEASATLHSTQCTSKKLSDVINTKRARDPKKELSMKNGNGEDESVSEFDDVRSKVSTNQKAHDQAKIIADDSDLSIAKDKLLTNENEENLSNSSKTTESISYLKKNTIDSALLDTVSYQSIAGSHFNEQEFSSKEYTTEGLHLNEEKSTNSLSNEVHMKSNKTSNNTELNFVQDAEMEMFEDITNADGWIDADSPGVAIQSNSAGFQMKRKLEEDDKWFCTLKKKWKSSIEKEKSIKNIDKSKYKNNEVCSTNLDLETRHSKNIKLREKDASRMDSMKNLTFQKLGSTDKEKHRKKSDSKNSNSTETLQNSEKKLKAKRKLVDVDFFTSPKKAKTKSQDQEKSQKSSSLTSKPQQITDNVKLKTLRKHILPKSSKLKESKAPTTETKTSKMKVEKHSQSPKAKISQVPNDVNSLFESEEEVGFSSDSFSDSEPETAESGTDTLKEIFNSYNPLKEKAKKHKSASVAGVSGLMSESISPAKEVQGLVKKKRVAHNPSYLVQRKTSRINPVRQLPKSASSIPTIQPKPTPETNAIQPKKRVAHAPKPTTQTSLARPRIPIEYGAKVPQNLRQRYLDKIIDENLRLYATEKEAFDKGLEEEQSIYERATRRPMYLNLCCNAIKVLRSKPTPEFQHVPVPSPLRRASTSSTTTRAGASIGNTKQKTIDPDNLTEESTYELLSQYVLDEEQLVENGYPRQCPSTPGKVTFKTRKPLPTPSKDPNRRTCCRCGRRYSVREDGTPVSQEECVYHFGRLFKRRTTGEISTSYQCCGGDASTPGCSVCKYHVIEGKDSTDGFMTTIISPLGNQKKIFGMDCEMCYTTAGLELTRVTVVDWKLEKVYDTFVKPDNPILDYNTRFSGVTQECLRGVKTSIREVQAVLLSMISKDSILVGHSLESDLLALKLVHSTVVDTSVVFPHRLGPPYKRALRTLMAEFVKKIIQSNEEGHDSYEDASAALELMIFKIKEDLKIKDTKKQKLPTK